MKLATLFFICVGAMIAAVAMTSVDMYTVPALIFSPVLWPSYLLLAMWGLIYKFDRTTASRRALLATSLLLGGATALAYIPAMGSRGSMGGMVFYLCFLLLPAVVVVFVVAYMIFGGLRQ